MPAFRSVNGAAAGPAALGILVPPGQRTVVVVRPRSLDFDLVVLSCAAVGALINGFLETEPGEAAILADGLRRALETNAARGAGQIQLVPNPNGFWVRVEVGAFGLVVCPRQPGQAYRPLCLPTEADARRTADAVAALLAPGPDANQEVYLNTQHFRGQESGVRNQGSGVRAQESGIGGQEPGRNS
jgi:hypothetical protein